MIQQAQNPLNLLGPLLFPQGTSNLPMEQMNNLPDMMAASNGSGSTQGAGDGLGDAAESSKNLNPAIMNKLQSEQLAELQKQYPHLQQELTYLMEQQNKQQQQRGVVEAVGAAGKLGGARQSSRECVETGDNSSEREDDGGTREVDSSNTEDNFSKRGQG